MPPLKIALVVYRHGLGFRATATVQGRKLAVKRPSCRDAALALLETTGFPVGKPAAGDGARAGELRSAVG